MGSTQCVVYFGDFLDAGSILPHSQHTYIYADRHTDRHTHTNTNSATCSGCNQSLG